MPTYFDPRGARERAREVIRSARVQPLRFTALLLAVSFVLSCIDAAGLRVLGGVTVMNYSLSFVSVLVMLINTVLSAGYSFYCLRVARGEALPYESLFDAFPIAGRVILLLVLQGVLIGVGLSLFVVPGVVLSLSYAMAPLYLCDNPDMSALDAQRRSRRDMRGHRVELLLLLLSFLPLLLLDALLVSGCDRLLSPLLPDTLVGDLLFVLAATVLTVPVELYLRPSLGVSRALFFRYVTADGDDPAEPPQV